MIGEIPLWYTKKMKLEHESAEKLRKDLFDIIYSEISREEYTAFFFGSRVSGTAGERSDIDVGIEGEKKVPAVSLAKIEDAVEALSTLYKIEIVDFARVSDDFKKVAKEEVEVVS